MAKTSFLLASVLIASIASVASSSQMFKARSPDPVGDRRTAIVVPVFVMITRGVNNSKSLHPPSTVAPMNGLNSPTPPASAQRFSSRSATRPLPTKQTTATGANAIDCDVDGNNYANTASNQRAYTAARQQQQPQQQQQQQQQPNTGGLTLFKFDKPVHEPSNSAMWQQTSNSGSKSTESKSGSTGAGSTAASASGASSTKSGSTWMQTKVGEPVLGSWKSTVAPSAGQTLDGSPANVDAREAAQNIAEGVKQDARRDARDSLKVVQFSEPVHAPSSPSQYQRAVPTPFGGRPTWQQAKANETAVASWTNKGDANDQKEMKKAQEFQNDGVSASKKQTSSSSASSFYSKKSSSSGMPSSGGSSNAASSRSTSNQNMDGMLPVNVTSGSLIEPVVDNKGRPSWPMLNKVNTKQVAFPKNFFSKQKTMSAQEAHRLTSLMLAKKSSSRTMSQSSGSKSSSGSSQSASGRSASTQGVIGMVPVNVTSGALITPVVDNKGRPSWPMVNKANSKQVVFPNDFFSTQKKMSAQEAHRLTSLMFASRAAKKSGRASEIHHWSRNGIPSPSNAAVFHLGNNKNAKNTNGSPAIPAKGPVELINDTADVIAKGNKADEKNTTGSPAIPAKGPVELVINGTADVIAKGNEADDASLLLVRGDVIKSSSGVPAAGTSSYAKKPTVMFNGAVVGDANNGSKAGNQYSNSASKAGPDNNGSVIINATGVYANGSKADEGAIVVGLTNLQNEPTSTSNGAVNGQNVNSAKKQVQEKKPTIMFNGVVDGRNSGGISGKGKRQSSQSSSGSASKPESQTQSSSSSSGAATRNNGGAGQGRPSSSSRSQSSSSSVGKKAPSPTTTPTKVSKAAFAGPIVRLNGTRVPTAMKDGLAVLLLPNATKNEILNGSNATNASAPGLAAPLKALLEGLKEYKQTKAPAKPEGESKAPSSTSSEQSSSGTKVPVPETNENDLIATLSKLLGLTEDKPAKRASAQLEDGSPRTKHQLYQNRQERT